jgi:hypothetical protein
MDIMKYVYDTVGGGEVPTVCVAEKELVLAQNPLIKKLFTERTHWCVIILIVKEFKVKEQQFLFLVHPIAVLALKTYSKLYTSTCMPTVCL